MYIREFTARNYLVHKNTAVKLSPITVFVGPNGGGKSALFDAILNFSMIARGNLKQAFGAFPYSYFATKYHGASKQARIGFNVGARILILQKRRAQLACGRARLPAVPQAADIACARNDLLSQSFRANRWVEQRFQRCVQNRHSRMTSRRVIHIRESFGGACDLCV